jgi:hypothetical protein
LPPLTRTFDEILDLAEEDLWTGFHLASVKQHRTLIGDSREESFADFLAMRLPDRFGVTSGEAVDSREKRTGQLDIVIYDRNLTAPLVRGKSGDVLPAESLLAVVEVKSTLTQGELEACAAAAKKIARLSPYRREFLPPRQQGLDASDGNHRCQYSVIAFKTNLGKGNWAEREWERLLKAAKKKKVDPERIDRVLVLDRGMLVPPSGSGRATTDGKGMLREWFLHLTNFLIREAERRPPFDFQDYGRRRKNPGWQRLP